MIKSLVGLALLIVSMGVSAEHWLAIERFKDGSVFYLDIDSMYKTKKDSVMVWILLDFHETQEMKGHKMLSWKVLEEYGCNNDKTRNHQINVYYGNIGSGKEIRLDPKLSGWRELDKSSMADQMASGFIGIHCALAP